MKILDITSTVQFELVSIEYDTGTQKWKVMIRSLNNNLFGWRRGDPGTLHGYVYVLDKDGTMTPVVAFENAVRRIRDNGDWRPILTHPQEIS